MTVIGVVVEIIVQKMPKGTATSLSKTFATGQFFKRQITIKLTVAQSLLCHQGMCFRVMHQMY